MLVVKLKDAMEAYRRRTGERGGRWLVQVPLAALRVLSEPGVRCEADEPPTAALHRQALLRPSLRAELLDPPDCNAEPRCRLHG